MGGKSILPTVFRKSTRDDSRKSKNNRGSHGSNEWDQDQSFHRITLELSRLIRHLSAPIRVIRVIRAQQSLGFEPGPSRVFDSYQETK